MTVKTLDSLTLEELQDTYLCSKYGKDPIKCLDCEKHESCPAGKRAIELLNEMTEAKKLSKWEKGAMTKSLQAKARAAEILKHEDPVKYLEGQGLKRSAALERIRKYKKKYPDLFDLPVKPSAKKPNRYRKSSVVEEDYMKAIKLEKPANYYVEKYGISYDAAWHRWKDDEKKFKKEVDTMANNEEEVSLEDFLNEANINPEVDTEAEITPDKTAPEKDISNHSLINSINAKYEEFLLKREKVKEEIEKLEDQLEWYDIALKSFETTMSVLEKE